jgi:hypothetical protein
VTAVRVVSFRPGGQDWAVALERMQRVPEEAAGPPAGQRSPLVAGVLAGTRPLLLLDVGALTGWLAP